MEQRPTGVVVDVDVIMARDHPSHGHVENPAHRATLTQPSKPASHSTSQDGFTATSVPGPLFQVDTSQPLTPEDLYALVDPKSPEKLAALGGAESIAARLGSSLKTGIRGDHILPNRERFGENRLPEPYFHSFLELVFNAIKDKTLIMLIIAALISLVVGIVTEGPELGWKDGVAVMVAVLFVVIVNSVNDYSKEKQFRALNAIKNDHPVTVVRDGDSTRISIYDVVVGDLLHMQSGDIVPADGIFLSGEAAEADESSATGESDNVKKGHSPGRDPIFLSGTQLVSGQATMLVICVGERSFHGHIMLALRTPDEDTPLQQKLARFADAIGNFGIFASTFIFLAQLIKYFAINGENVDAGEAGNNVVDFLVIAISIVVVAVPEGLPLAVTIALAYSMKNMMKDNNLVRHMDACETMGGATTICSDKTGTLTQNKMTAVQGRVLETSFAQDGLGNAVDAALGQPFPVSTTGSSDRIAPPALGMFFKAVAINSTAYTSTNDNGIKAIIGSKTESALLQFLERYGQSFEDLRQKADIRHVVPFSSEMKRMSTVVAEQWPWGPSEGPFVFHTKGAAEVVLKMCNRVLTSQGEVEPLTDSKRAEYTALLARLNAQALRAICLAARPTREEKLDWTCEPNPELICIGIVGIQDPLRPEIKAAVAQCKKAGVVVRMVTGDALAIAKSIGTECGIYNEANGDICIEGPAFRELSEEEVTSILPKLRILARSSPTDKYNLVSALQRLHEVVAVTGDGMNDGPALKKADVGFAMGIAGTDVAKEASAIVLLDDNFASIVNAIKWGRGVFDNIRKFLQFQLTVNFTAIMFVFIVLMADSTGNADNIPLKPVQLLWINLIMDSFAAVALATEPPSMKLLDFKPFDRAEPLLTTRMQRRMVTQVVMQTITFLTLLYAGSPLFQTEKEPEDDEETEFSVRHYTVIFNTFVLTQLFNQFNSRKLRGEINVFGGLHKHKLFGGIWLSAFVIQVLFVQFGGTAVETEALTGAQWGGCIAIAMLTFLWSFIFGLLPSSWTSEHLPWVDACFARAARMFPCIRTCVKARKTEEDQEEDQEDQEEAEGTLAGELEALQAESSTDLAPVEGIHGSPQLVRAVSAQQREEERRRREARKRWSKAIGAIQTQMSVVELLRRRHR